MNAPFDPSSAYPREHRQPIFNAPPGTVWLCVLLTTAHLVFSLVPEEWQMLLLEQFAFVPGRFQQQVEEGWSVQEGITTVSYLFLHGDWLHLIVNAGMLLAFGSLVERAAGTFRMVSMFLLCGIAAALVQMLASGTQWIAVIGASGAGYGLIGASVPYLFASNIGRGPRQALLFIGAIMGLNLLFGLTGLGTFIAGADIAWQAHIGGFIAGLALAYLLRSRSF
jgi:membrane associated rhomboid family serine protease